MNETVTRIFTALVAGPLAIWMLVLGNWWWAGFVALVVVISQSEFYTIMAAKSFRPHRALGNVVSVALIVVAQAAGMNFAAGMLTAGILALLVVQLSRTEAVGAAIPNVSVSMAGVLYVGWLLSHGIYLRHLEVAGVDVGVFAVLFALVTTFLNDTGAYFTGRRFGRHPVAPNVSPNKTWEGLAGGLVTAIAGATGFSWGWQQMAYPLPFSLQGMAILGGILGLVGFGGDLVESLLKRDAEVKDSGSLLPGHGGLLDRIDAVLFTVPFTYYALALIVQLRS